MKHGTFPAHLFFIDEEWAWLFIPFTQIKEDCLYWIYHAISDVHVHFYTLLENVCLGFF